VVKHIDTAKLRAVVAAVLTVAVNTVLVAQHLLKIGAHLVTALARLHCLISRVIAAWRQGARGRKKAGRSRGS
jgi:hypothetical protein